MSDTVGRYFEMARLCFNYCTCYSSMVLTFPFSSKGAFTNKVTPFGLTLPFSFHAQKGSYINHVDS